MEDHRTPRYDGSERYSKKTAKGDTLTLTSNARARAGFTALFGDATINTDGVVAKPTFFGQLHVRDVDGPREAWVTGPAVGLEEVA